MLQPYYDLAKLCRKEALAPEGASWFLLAAPVIGVDGPDSYTAFGFANPTRRVLAGVLHTRTEVSVHVTEGNDLPADDAGR